jgi:hypothetical protein
LRGARIGLIDNRKRHSDVFLGRLQELLSERYGVAGFQYYTKQGASVPTPDDIMVDLTQNCDAVMRSPIEVPVQRAVCMTEQKLRKKVDRRRRY